MEMLTCVWAMLKKLAVIGGVLMAMFQAPFHSGSSSILFWLCFHLQHNSLCLTFQFIAAISVYGSQYILLLSFLLTIKWVVEGGGRRKGWVAVYCSLFLSPDLFLLSYCFPSLCCKFSLKAPSCLIFLRTLCSDWRVLRPVFCALLFH